MTPLLEVRHLGKTFRSRKGLPWGAKAVAIEPLSFTLEPGETLAVMGETGSGKSTLAKIIGGVDTPTSGDIFLKGKKLHSNNYAQLCHNIRMIFQDSENSLNAHLTIGKQLEEPLLFNTKLTAAERKDCVNLALQRVGMLREHWEFYPHMLSSGQKQRVCIARAIILEPDIVVADEALVGLDPSVRAQIINLMLDLQKDMGISYILVTHSPQIVKHFTDKILILYRGKMIAFDKTDIILNETQQPYVEQLLHKHLLQNTQYNSDTSAKIAD